MPGTIAVELKKEKATITKDDKLAEYFSQKKSLNKSSVELGKNIV